MAQKKSFLRMTSRIMLRLSTHFCYARTLANSRSIAIVIVCRRRNDLCRFFFFFVCQATVSTGPQRSKYTFTTFDMIQRYRVRNAGHNAIRRYVNIINIDLRRPIVYSSYRSYYKSAESFRRRWKHSHDFSSSSSGERHWRATASRITHD